jgi:hypothetical protein
MSADNFTKIYHTHTIKAGVYAEQTRNNQVTLGSEANGNISFDRYTGCLPNQTTPSYSTDPTTGNVSLQACPPFDVAREIPRPTSWQAAPAVTPRHTSIPAWTCTSTLLSSM